MLLTGGLSLSMKKRKLSYQDLWCKLWRFKNACSVSEGPLFHCLYSSELSILEDTPQVLGGEHLCLKTQKFFFCSVCVREHACVRMHMCVRARVCTCVHVCTRVCMSALCVCAHVRGRVCVCGFVGFMFLIGLFWSNEDWAQGLICAQQALNSWDTFWDPRLLSKFVFYFVHLLFYSFGLGVGLLLGV